MNLKKLIILMSIMAFTTASAPYCIYSTTKVKFLEEYEDYTCEIYIEGQLDILDEIWGSRDPEDRKSDSDVKILSVIEQSKGLMTIFPPKFCEHYPNIKVIDMSDAEIKEVKINALENCRNLEIVVIYKNKLTDIDEDFLKHNPRLKVVHLNYNEFTTFPEDLFRNQDELQVLDLAVNNLEMLPERIFSSLQNLKSLNLDTNKLQILNPEWFRSLEKLENLDLSSNGINELPENVFSSLNTLKSLNLGDNNLKIIHSHSFGQHPQLGTVLFDKNKIDSIDRRFKKQTKIRVLNMKGNACSDDPKITGRDMDRKLSLCYRNFDEKTATTTTTTKTRKPTTTTTTESTTTTKKTTTTTKPATAITKKTTTQKTTMKTTLSTTIAPNPTLGRTTAIRVSDIDEDRCGERGTGVPLVIEGYELEHGSYPWMAVLIVGGKVHCGGVLISKARVVTAGHCILTKTLRRINESEIIVVLGGHNLNLLYEIDRLAFGVSEIHVHPNWKEYLSRFDSDIAVLMLKEDMTYNDHIKPICVALPNTAASKVTDGTIVGYGKTEDKSREFSNVPKQAETPIHDLVTCIKKFPQIHPIANHKTFCGGHGNGTGACTGDSGGGLFVKVGKKFYLRGIVSASLTGTEYGCNVDAYSLFTDITPFINWIYETGNNIISTRTEGESPKPFEPPWLKIKQNVQPLYGGRPVWT